MGAVTRKAKSVDETWLMTLPVSLVHDIKNALDYAMATAPDDRFTEFRRAKVAFGEAIEQAKVK